MEVMSVEAAKKVDYRTINEIGIPSLVLMENVAQKIYDNIVHKGIKYVLFCGTGNNGADGLAVARKLIIEGKEVKVYIVSDITKGTTEFKRNYEILINLKATIYEMKSFNKKQVVQDLQEADIVVDSIFGVGLNREIKGEIFEVIDLINSYSSYIVSIDVPSGLECNKGKACGIAIKANDTFTIEVLKKGFFKSRAKEFTGQVTIINIGVPPYIKNEESEKTYTLTRDDYKKLIPKRAIYGHKGDYGRVVVLAGSRNMVGAAYITTEAAVRVGAGLVTLVVEDDIQQLMAVRLTEAMTVGYNDTKIINNLLSNADVIICGPGLSKEKINSDMLKKFIKNTKCNMVIDADGLNIISECKELLQYLKGRAVFTPHIGEMARLIKRDISQIEENRIEFCRQYSEKNKIVTLLKGFNTVISKKGNTIINETGNSKMASGGMGDCLSGIIGGLIAQGMSNYDATVLGAYIHGLIGDQLSKERYIVNARDIIDKLPKLMGELFSNLE